MPAKGFESSSASRRRASAMPSSSSWRTDGSDPSRCAARTTLWLSGKSNASFSTSAIVAMTGNIMRRAMKASVALQPAMTVCGGVRNDPLGMTVKGFDQSRGSTIAFSIILAGQRWEIICTLVAESCPRFRFSSQSAEKHFSAASASPRAIRFMLKNVSRGGAESAEADARSNWFFPLFGRRRIEKNRSSS